MASDEKTTDSVQGTTPAMTDNESNCPQLEVEDKSITKYFTQDIRGSMFTEFQLVLLTFCTGMQGK